jgi:predicted alpha/beta-hydrolase family hydrolase
MSVERIEIGSEPPVRGVLHPVGARRADGLVLTHGAGGNAEGPLLVAVAEAFVSRGAAGLRCELALRQARPRGEHRPAPSGSRRLRAALECSPSA